jgi:hypothetical protein
MMESHGPRVKPGRPAIAPHAAPATSFQQPRRGLPARLRTGAPMSDRRTLWQAGGSCAGAVCSAGSTRGPSTASASVLMGLSGSGKSTLLRAANGLNRVTRGQVLVADGESVYTYQAELDGAHTTPLGARVTILEGGRIVQTGTGRDIVERPAND